MFTLQIIHLEREFSSYKIRAHALLQKKDAELAAATDTEQLRALEEALKVLIVAFIFQNQEKHLIAIWDC